MKRSTWRTLAACTALALSACATLPDESAPPAPPAGLFEDTAFGAPREAPDVAAVFALSPEMRRFVDVDMATSIRQLGRQRALADALLREALRLEYDAQQTRTAAQAFDARAGNCLSLVVMAAALARHLELPLAYQALVGHETWSRSGDLSIVNGHVNIVVGKRLIDRAAYDTDPDIRIDFGSVAPGRGQALREVSEATIVSMFLNNRAAEHLVRGELDDAYAHAREAVRHDPLYAGAYNTLGVIYQRRGLDRAAERAYRGALQRAQDHKPALLNIGRLLRAAGRVDEAVPFEQRLAAIERDPPFVHFDLGVAAARAGNYAAARDHLMAEMKRDPDYHEFHFWLAVAHYGLGDTRQAREHLDRAVRHSITRRERDLYAAKLRSLGPAAATRTN